MIEQIKERFRSGYYKTNNITEKEKNIKFKNKDVLLKNNKEKNNKTKNTNVVLKNNKEKRFGNQSEAF